MSSRIDGWLWGSPLLQKRKWGCTSWEPKSWQVSARASYRYSFRSRKLVSSPNAEGAHSQVGGLEKMRHSSSHNRGDVQAYCFPPHSRPDLLDWWPASSWHMESVERWKCGGEREIKSNPALWSLNLCRFLSDFKRLEVIIAGIMADCHWSFPLQVVRGTARQLRDHFPGVTVLPALGNHESVPVDSFPQPSVTGDPGRETNSYWLSLLETWRYVLALHYSGGGVGRVVGRGAQLDDQVRHQTLFVWKKMINKEMKVKLQLFWLLTSHG